MNHFIGSFVINSRVSFGLEYLGFLPHLYKSSLPDSCVHKSMNAVAKIHFVNRLKVDSKAETEQQYGEALLAINAALRHPTDCLKDETLISVWMLGLYEVSHSS